MKLTHLHIQRMPGLGKPIELADLSPQVNVVMGSNGAGKSRCARAIALATWPVLASDHADALTADWQDGTQPLTLHIDAGLKRWTRDGVAATPPPLPAAEHERRFRLELADLLRDDEREFAAEIRKQLAGGVDLDKLRTSLNASEKPPGHMIAEATALRNAEQDVADLERVQRALLDEQQSLSSLRNRLADARAADASLARVRQSLAYLQSDAELHAARARLTAMPAALGKLTGREQQTLDDFRSRLSAARARETTLKRQAQDAAAEMTALGLPAELAGNETVLPSLRKRVTVIRDLWAKHRELELRQAGAAEESAAAARVLGASATPQSLRTLDVHGLDELTTFLRQHEEVVSETRAIDRSLRLLKPDDEQDTPPTADEMKQLGEAMALLGRWLRSPRTARLNLPGLVAAVLATALGGVLAWRVSPWFAIAAVAGVVLTALCLRHGTAARERATVEHAFGRLGLGQVNWTVRDVEHHLLSFTDMREKLLADDHLRTLRQTLLAQRDNDAREREEARLALWRTNLLERFGTEAEQFAVTPQSSVLRLDQLLAAVRGWQKADAEFGRIEAQARAAARQAVDAAAMLAAELQQAGVPCAERPEDLEGGVEVLARRVQHHTDLAHQRRAADRQLPHSQQDVQSLEQQIESLYTSLELAAGDEAALDLLLARRAAYLAAANDVERCAGVLEDRRRAMSGATVEETAESLHSREQSLKDESRKAEDLQKAVVQIETKIDAAKRGHSLEEALRQRDLAATALERRREAAMQAAASHELVAWLAEQVRRRHRPAMLQRADALLRQFTRGAYTLEVDGDQITATETSTRHVRQLSELSAGTRVQLLLAVKLAAAESAERGVMLPIVLDETLANSDAARATAVIEAVGELARNGRQVFVFTAQPDEAERWRAVLEPAGVQVSLRTLGELPARVLNAAPAIAPRLPEPAAEESAIAYAGRAAVDAPQLAVTPIEPLALTTDALHVAHLLPDAATAYQVLSRGINTWGQLRAMQSAGLLDDEALAHATERAALIEAACRLWQIGRGRPVERHHLAECDAVSDAFLDRIDAVATKTDRNARRLVHALRNGRVKGFGRAKTQSLSEWLLEQGLLDEASPLDVDALRSRLQAETAASDDEVNAIIALIASGQSTRQLQSA